MKEKGSEKEAVYNLSIRCIHSHEDGLTKGKTYNAKKQGEWGYDVYPDDYGHLSGWDKRYFEPNPIIGIE